jgi:hypothetical protein
MSKNTRIVFLAAIACTALITLVLVWNSRFSPQVQDCGDGPRTTIDTRDFQTRYSAYSVEIEASISDRQKLAGKLEPHQLQQLSEALQMANEFRKWLVAGYNSCAISKGQFAEFGTRFQHLDQLSRQIDNLSNKATLTSDDSRTLSSLVEEYRATASTLGRQQ